MPFSKNQQLANPPSELTRLADQTQAEFELTFFAGILERHPNYVEVLRSQAKLLASLKRHQEGTEIDRRLTRLRPSDPLTHYNLACSCSLTGQFTEALESLRKSLELGYRDLDFIRADRDLDPLREDPRFNKLLAEYADE